MPLQSVVTNQTTVINVLKKWNLGWVMGKTEPMESLEN